VSRNTISSLDQSIVEWSTNLPCSRAGCRVVWTHRDRSTDNCPPCSHRCADSRRCWTRIRPYLHHRRSHNQSINQSISLLELQHISIWSQQNTRWYGNHSQCLVSHAISTQTSRY